MSRQANLLASRIDAELKELLLIVARVQQAWEKARTQNANQLESKAGKHMRTLQNDRLKTKKFFKHPSITYAA